MILDEISDENNGLIIPTYNFSIRNTPCLTFATVTGIGRASIAFAFDNSAFFLFTANIAMAIKMQIRTNKNTF